jgi:hypothetical protein
VCYKPDAHMHRAPSSTVDEKNVKLTSTGGNDLRVVTLERASFSFGGRVRSAISQKLDRHKGFGMWRFYK